MFTKRLITIVIILLALVSAGAGLLSTTGATRFDALNTRRRRIVFPVSVERPRLDGEHARPHVCREKIRFERLVGEIIRAFRGSESGKQNDGRVAC